MTIFFNKQKGTVLIIALLVVAIIVGLATSFAARFNLTVKRTENRLINGQLQQYWYAIENAATRVLLEDRENDISNGYKQVFDHLGEDWSKQENIDTARTLIQAELGDAVLVNRLSIVDAQSRFDINKLSRIGNYDASKSFQDRYSEDQKRFIRLLQTRNNPNDPALVTVDEAQQIVDAIADWIDSDPTPQGDGGAEDGYYLSKDPAYRAANQPFTSVTELLMVQGFEERQELYRELQPLLVALPEGKGLNMNTADSQLVRMINVSANPDPIDAEDADKLIVDRPSASTVYDDNGIAIASADDAFEDVEKDLPDVADYAVIFPDPADQPNLDNLVAGTEYFIVMAELQIADVSRLFYSLLERKEKGGSNRMAVLRRSSDGVF